MPDVVGFIVSEDETVHATTAAARKGAQKRGRGER
jgi:hypothetical protein